MRRAARRCANLSFEVELRRTGVFVTGHSGAGKTHAAQTDCADRATDARPGTRSKGAISVDCRIAGSPAHRRKIGMVFQDHKLLEDRTVYENIALPMIIAELHAPGNWRTGAGRRSIMSGSLDKRKTVPPPMLSTGEQQRIGIARALVVARPKLLIADEPTGNLDPESIAGYHEPVPALQRSRRHDADRNA